MTMDDVMERLSSDSEARNKWVGVYIGILAVLLAIVPWAVRTPPRTLRAPISRPPIPGRSSRPRTSGDTTMNDGDRRAGVRLAGQGSPRRREAIEDK